MSLSDLMYRAGIGFYRCSVRNGIVYVDDIVIGTFAEIFVMTPDDIREKIYGKGVQQ